MFNVSKEKQKPETPSANHVLHEWDREDEWDAVEQLSEAEEIHTLGELFALHRVIHEFKERKGMREEKADTRFLRHSVH